MPEYFFFGPEQGRDMLAIREIVENQNLTLVGSKTDIDGVMHGPIFYYLGSIPYALSGGNPIAVFGFFVLVGAVTIFLVYQCVLELTSKRSLSYIASLLFATSYIFSVYARWLSNPPLSIPLSLIFFISYMRFLKGKYRYLIIAAITIGLLGQAEFINFFLYGICSLMLIIFHRYNFLKAPLTIRLFSLFGVAVSSLGTYVLFDLRHNFLFLKSIIKLLSGETGMRIDLWSSISGAFSMLWRQTGLMIGSPSVLVGSFLYIGASFVVWRNVKRSQAYAVLLLFIVVPPMLFSLLRHPTLEQLYAGILIYVFIGIALFIGELWRYNRILALCAIVLSVGTNILSFVRLIPKSEYVFYQGQQPYIRYTDQIAVLDWIYVHAAGERFSLQAYTIPYFWQDAWVYLAEYVGNKKYGYVPDNQGRKITYVIIQRDGLDPEYQKQWYDKTVSRWGTKTNETLIGEYRVEELRIK